MLPPTEGRPLALAFVVHLSRLRLHCHRATRSVPRAPMIRSAEPVGDQGRPRPSGRAIDPHQPPCAPERCVPARPSRRGGHPDDIVCDGETERKPSGGHGNDNGDPPGRQVNLDHFLMALHGLQQPGVISGHVKLAAGEASELDCATQAAHVEVDRVETTPVLCQSWYRRPPRPRRGGRLR